MMIVKLPSYILPSCDQITYANLLKSSTSTIHERQQTKVGWMVAKMVFLTVGSMTRVGVDEDIHGLGILRLDLFNQLE